MGEWKVLVHVVSRILPLRADSMLRLGLTVLLVAPPFSNPLSNSSIHRPPRHYHALSPILLSLPCPLLLMHCRLPRSSSSSLTSLLWLLSKAVAHFICSCSCSLSFFLSPPCLLFVLCLCLALLFCTGSSKLNMDLISWSLNATDKIFSTRSAGVGEPVCPDGTFAAGYIMDSWGKWRVLCLAVLSLEDVEDVYIFGLMMIGLLLLGLGVALTYRQIKMQAAEVAAQKLPDRITEVGRAFGSQLNAQNVEL